MGAAHRATFANITFMSDKAEFGLASLLETTVLKAAVETHLREAQLEHFLARAAKNGKYNYFVCPARPSDRSEIGTFGEGRF